MSELGRLVFENEEDIGDSYSLLVKETERLTNTLLLTNEKLASEIVRVKQFGEQLDALRSVKPVPCEQQPTLNEESEVFPSIVPLSMPFSYSVNRTTVGHHNIWWDRDFKAGWGNETLHAFKKLLTPNTVHIDFGAWIGPTVLFAANIAKRVIAFECDPYAERELLSHVRANPYLSHKISVSSLCISDHIHSTTMTGRGGSGSTVNTVSKEHFDRIANISKTVWTVNCVPLLKILEEQRLLDGNSDIFIKMDTEGAESIILPSLYEWLSKLDAKTKPTMLVSMHAQFSRLSEKPDKIQQILKTFSTFRYATPWGAAQRKESSSWTEAYLISDCAGCDVLLTDKELPFN